MRISEFYETGKPVFSFEFFPPRDDEAAQKLARTIADLEGSGGVSVSGIMEAIQYRRPSL